MKPRLAKATKIAGIALLGLATLYVALDLWGSWRLRRACQALEQDGRPMTWTQLAKPKPGDLYNAAPVYQAAALLLKSHLLDDRNALSKLEDLCMASTPEARAKLALAFQDPTIANALREVEAASRRPCVFDLDFSQGFDLKLAHLRDLKSLAFILAAKAQVQAAGGDTAGAWETALVNFRLGNALKDEPTLISQLVRIAMLSIAIDGAEHLAATSLPDDRQLAELQALLPSLLDRQPIIRAMDGERLMTQEAMQKKNLAKALLTDENSGMTQCLLRFSPLGKWDLSVYCASLHQYTAALAHPLAPEDCVRLEQPPPKLAVISSMMLPVLTKVDQKFSGMQARAKVLVVGLQILKHQRQQGAWPKDFATAGITDAADPFTGKPLVYKPTDKGFLLYSVSFNQKDDGGQAAPPGKSRFFYLDIPWEYPEPKPQDPMETGNRPF